MTTRSLSMSDVFIKCQINWCVFVCFFSFNPQTQIYVSWPTFAHRRNWIYIEISIFNFYNSFATCTCLWVYKISECDTREAIVKMAQPCIFAEIPRMHGKLYPHEIALSMQFFSNHFMIYGPFTFGPHKCTKLLWACNYFTNNQMIYGPLTWPW